MIPVTKPFLPPREKFDKYVNEIWHRNWLTNNGPLVNELEIRLKQYLNIKHLLFVTNGTIALQLAIKALNLKGEIITTPFSYVATTSSIVWEGCKPVFVDIDEKTFNIDANKIEQAITPKTSAILATHVFGNPCEVEKIQKIANKHKLKVIYDAAHAFGVTLKGKSIFEYGDISTTSFHATKLFHTIEGGAVITKDAALLRKMSLLRNFGHTSATTFEGIGINAKNSEFHAAMGLCNIEHIFEIINRRKLLCEYYDQRLKALNILRPQFPASGYNYAYYPIVFENNTLLLRVKDQLEKHRIYPRRYFYPNLSTLDYIRDQKQMPVSDKVSTNILCLPLYHTLSIEEVTFICRLVIRTHNYFH